MKCKWRTCGVQLSKEKWIRRETGLRREWRTTLKVIQAQDSLSRANDNQIAAPSA